MAAGIHDISVERGGSVSWHFRWQDGTTANAPGIDLSSYYGRMQIRRSHINEKIILELNGSTAHSTDSYALHGGTTGEFESGSGTRGATGNGLYLNTSSTGSTHGGTGGILLNLDSTITQTLPPGKHVYDLELYHQ